MPAPRDLVRRAREALSQAVDPVVAKRAETLVEYRSKSRRRTSTRRDEAVDRLRQRVLDELRAAASDGSARGADIVDELVAARLASVNPKTPDALALQVSNAFGRLFQPDAMPVREPRPFITKTISDQFHNLYYHCSQRTWQQTSYAGVTTYKCPTDMWIYTELIDRIKPALVLETGTLFGGSALYLAHVLERIGHGEVVTVDIGERPGRPVHDRITYITGSSTAPEIVEQVRARVPADGPVLVILDSDHSRDHVFGELEAYASLVTPGSYLIVEDSNINGHPAWPSWGPGPFEAVEDFLKTTDDFVVDEACERYFLTQNPRGYLQRVR